MSIDQVAQDTRISPRFLEALEAEQFEELPAPVYVRGFIRSYANYLKIEPQPLLDRLVGGDMAASGGTEGYVRGQRGITPAARNGTRRTDPFQKRGVVAAPPLAEPRLPMTEPEEPADDGWAPEPPRPLSPPPAGHGYIPGSDLMEDPERIEYEYEPEPSAYPPRPVGVLAERPPSPGEPGIPRRVALFGGGVLALLAFLALAVFMTRGGGDGDSDKASNNGGGSTPELTPGSVIPVGARTATAGPGGSATASVSPSASATGTVTGTTTPGTPSPTSAPGTATATATPAQTTTPQPTSAPTATPTPPPPTATATRVPTVAPGNLGFGECQATGTGSYDCGGAPYRVICFTPINPALNKNWWVDVNWDWGTVPTNLGWRETTVSDPSNGAIISAGASGCG